MKGGIYRQKGRNTYRVWIPWNGKTIWKNRYLDGTPIYHEEQAKRVLEKMRGEIDAGIFDPATWGSDRSLVFQNAWRIYQEQKPAGKDRMQARERIFNDFLLPYFKDKSLKEIEEHHINHWWSEIPKGYAPSTLKVIRATLRAFLNFNKITRMKAIKFPSITIPKKAIEWLKPDQQQKIMEFIPKQHMAIFSFLLVYGCRTSEVCNLRRSDIDWAKRIISFRERKNMKDNSLALLSEVEWTLKGKISHLEYAFCTINGRQYTRQQLYNQWEYASKKAFEKYGVPIMSLKNGSRHSLACQLLNRGRSVAEVARILGNTSNVVQRYYGEISVERTEEILRIAEI